MNSRNFEKKLNVLVVSEIIVFALVIYLFNISKHVVDTFGSWQAPGIPALYRFLFWFFYFPGIFFNEKLGSFGFLFFWMFWPLCYFFIRNSRSRARSFLLMSASFFTVVTVSLAYLYASGGTR